jgi:hypothetical protein
MGENSPNLVTLVDGALVASATHFEPGLPDFSWYKMPKREEITKWPQNIQNNHKRNQNCHNIYQMAVK